MKSIFFESRSGGRPEDRGEVSAGLPLEPAAVVRRILRDYVWPRRALVAVTILAMAVAAGATGALPFLIQRAADEIFVAKNAALVYGLPPVIIAVMLGRSAAEYVSRVAQGFLSNRIVADLRNELFRKLTFADVGWLQGTHSGRYAAVFMNDVAVVNAAATQSVLGIVQNGLHTLFLVIAMVSMDWLLALIVLSVLPLGGWLLQLQRRRAQSSTTSQLQEVGALGSAIAETLKSIRVVKAYGREARETERAVGIIERTMEHSMTAVRTRAASGPITEALAGIGIAAAIFYAGYQGVNGSLTLGHFMGFVTAAMLLYQPLKTLATLHNQLIEGSVAATRVFAIFDEPKAVTEAPDARALAVSAGAIRFDKVTFGYEAGQPVLKEFSLDIPAGTKVALVGPSGSGKSTVMNLLLRFFDPQEGRILFDGQDIRTATIASVRGASALLTQEPVLFDDTIEANIRYGSEHVDRAAVEAAARAAAAHDFIVELPKGYATEVGEAGQLLSGGQKQRIAFARAMLRDAPILLLDEPTSALDAESEAKIQEAMDTLLAGRTVIVIAHRLSTIRKADMICVMKDGSIAELGSHDELVARDGLYARLQRGQFGDGEAVRPLRQAAGA